MNDEQWRSDAVEVENRRGVHIKFSLFPEGSAQQLLSSSRPYVVTGHARVQATIVADGIHDSRASNAGGKSGRVRKQLKNRRPAETLPHYPYMIWIGDAEAHELLHARNDDVAKNFCLFLRVWNAQD